MQIMLPIIGVLSFIMTGWSAKLSRVSGYLACLYVHSFIYIFIYFFWGGGGGRGSGDCFVELSTDFTNPSSLVIRTERPHIGIVLVCMLCHSWI